MNIKDVQNLFCIIIMLKVINKLIKNSCTINIQVTYIFSILNKFIDFSESIWILTILFNVFENSFFEKNQGFNCQ